MSIFIATLMAFLNLKLNLNILDFSSQRRLFPNNSWTVIKLNSPIKAGFHIIAKDHMMTEILMCLLTRTVIKSIVSIISFDVPACIQLGRLNWLNVNYFGKSFDCKLIAGDSRSWFAYDSTITILTIDHSWLH